MIGIGQLPISGTLDRLKLLDAAFEKVAKRTRDNVKRSVDKGSRRVQLAIRKDVNRIFSGGSFKRNRSKGGRIGNAVRRKMFDNKERGHAALIYSKFGRRQGGEFVDYLSPYLTGKDIRPKRSRFLVVPLQPGKKNRRPSNFTDLASVKTGGRVFLVRHTKTRTMFMFLLLPRIKITKRLRASRIAKRETKRAFDDMRGALRV